ncbi:MAG: copper-binding protein [Candidatus Rokuibacteriota bacterium]
MRVWRAVLLVNLALVIGLGWGWVTWGRRAERLARELEVARGAAPLGGERVFQGHGLVRATLPDIGVVVISHGDIPGYMPGMTMGFRADPPKIVERFQPGDAVRFTLKGTLPYLNLSAIEREK